MAERATPASLDFIVRSGVQSALGTSLLPNTHNLGVQRSFLARPHGSRYQGDIRKFVHLVENARAAWTTRRVLLSLPPYFSLAMTRRRRSALALSPRPCKLPSPSARRGGSCLSFAKNRQNDQPFARTRTGMLPDWVASLGHAPLAPAPGTRL